MAAGKTNDWVVGHEISAANWAATFMDHACEFEGDGHVYVHQARIPRFDHVFDSALLVEFIIVVVVT